MKYISFDQPQKVHFIGIGGISMSGLAHVLKHHGFTVSGSDQRPSAITKDLEAIGIEVMSGHATKHITPDMDLIVYTAAISVDNPEYLQGKELGIPVIDRATLLGEIMSNYPYSIGVSGTHGKTTTTSMLANVLLAAEKDPTISVGGLLDAIDGNIRIGTSDCFLTEACEYTNSFLKFYPYIGIILNVEEDHMDFFKDLADIRQSFRTYAEQVQKDGYLIVNNAIDQLDDITKGLECRVITCGIDDDSANYYATNIQHVNHVLPTFDVMKNNTCLGRIEMNIPGRHNIENAVCAFAAADCLNISFEKIAKGLYNFKGTKRRFEYKGNLNGITVMDDYAHHPTAIKANLEVLKQYPHEKLWVVFQPHTYTRTKAFLEDFAKSLALADQVVLTDIYAAREVDPGDVHSKDIVNLMKETMEEVTYLPSFEDIEKYLLENCSPGDLLITMGAGDVYTLGENLLNR